MCCCYRICTGKWLSVLVPRMNGYFLEGRLFVPLREYLVVDRHPLNAEGKRVTANERFAGFGMHLLSVSCSF